MVSARDQARIDALRDYIDILEEDYAESKDDRILTQINEIYEEIDLLEQNSRD